jgi:hypothetical protein
LIEGHDQRLNAYRLDEVASETGVQRMLAILLLTVAGSGNQRRIGTVLGPQSLGQFVPVESGQADVEDGGVRHESAPSIECALRVMGHSSLETLHLQSHGQKIG